MKTGEHQCEERVRASTSALAQLHLTWIQRSCPSGNFNQPAVVLQAESFSKPVHANLGSSRCRCSGHGEIAVAAREKKAGFNQPSTEQDREGQRKIWANFMDRLLCFAKSLADECDVTFAKLRAAKTMAWEVHTLHRW